jgi:phosphoadenosine phosphosulfate reductase
MAEPVDFEALKEKILIYRKQGKKLFTSSSFQTHSIPLLHMLSRIDNTIPVVFLNTGFHFPETIEFRDRIIEQFDMKLIDLKPDTPKIMQLGTDGKLLFTSDPDRCCYLNKTLAMERILLSFDVWINGVRAEQNENRSKLSVEEPAPHDVLRFHPMIDWTSKMIYEYRKQYDLPEHPMESRGYFSIGCEPCTRRYDPETLEREARWYGMKKTECGLHTELVNKES